MRERRALRSAEERERLGVELARHAAALGGDPIAAFVGIRGEPHTLPLLAALRARGVRVVLPLLRDDLDLEWADYDGDPATLPAGPRRGRPPTGPAPGGDGQPRAEGRPPPPPRVASGGRPGR